MTALEAQDGDGGDWLDLTDFARAHGADVRQLWRRAIFGVLVGNLDDHLRDHGFLRRGGGWALSPAFDVNPEPLGHGDDHELALFGTTTLDVSAFLTKEALSMFGLSAAEARTHLAALVPLLGALPRSAEHHGADARSVRLMQTRLDAAAARLG
ncbi:HipA domain-containing protein [Microbacterium sp. TL13]|nr:HipA domain-containing protein [Microbacterium sp. TL13]